MRTATPARHRRAGISDMRRLRRSATVFPAVALACVLAALIASPSAQAESLCTETWNGSSEGSWEAASSWVPGGHVPGSTDVACIGSGKTVTVSSGTNHAGVVQGEGTLVISGGSLEVSNALEPSDIKNLTLSKGSEFGEGTLTGAAEVVVTGAFNALGFLSGSGSTVIASGATGTVTPFSANGLAIEERTLRNLGTLTVGKGTGVAGSRHASLINSGTLIVNGETGAQSHGLIASPSEATLINTGTVKKTEGSGVTPMQFAINNEATITDTSGKMEFTGGGTSGVGAVGSWSATGTGTAILFTGNYQTWTLGAKVPLTGTFEVQAGTVTAGKIEGSAASVVVTSYATESTGTLEVTGSTPSTVANLTVTKGSLWRAGTLASSAEIDVTSSFTGGGYGTISGTGSTVIEPGATGTITPTGGSGFYLEGSTLRNAGTLTVPKGSGLQGAKGAKLINTGTLIVNGETAADSHGLIASAKEAKLTNYGRMTKTEGTGKTPIQFEFENLGSDKPETGSFEILYPVTATAPPAHYGGGQNVSAPGQRSCESGKAVNCATGNESQAQTDFAIGGRGVGLTLTRTYNSQAAAEGAKGAFGYGWTASFSDHLVVEPANKTATLVQGTGSTVAFTEGTGGTYTAPAWSPDTLTGSSEAGYTVTLPSQIKYHFAGSGGRLETVTDRNSNTTTLSYTEAGRLEAITDPASRKITFAYNAEGLIENAKDPMGHEVKYGYAAGNLASVSRPGELTPNWQFEYDASHQMTTQTDGRANKTTRKYNAAHQVESETDPMERTLSFEYEPFHTRLTNKATGAVTDEYFTSNDEPSAITRGYGTASATTESFTYNEAGYTTSVTDGNGHTTQYKYDAANNRTSMLDAAEHEAKWGYNATRDVISTTTPRGETTTIKRDSHGNAEVIERPAPAAKTQLTKYKYDASGNLESVTDPLERVWKYEYNSHGDRTGETDPAGDRRTWGYDEDSQATTTVSPRGHVKVGEEATYTTKIERDARERPLKITNPLGKTNKYTYCANGDLETAVDTKAATTTYTYNADDELIKIKEPNGNVTETGYDGAGLITSQTDGNKHVTKYVRNVIGEITEVVDPLLRKTTREYDLAGNLKALTDPTKRVTTYTFDPVNRPTEVSYSDGKTPAVKYEYDADGERTKMVDGTGTTTYVYDQLDRPTETKDGHGDLSSYEYDLADQLTKITYPNGKAVARSYDSAGRLQKVTDWLEHTSKFGYDADSDPTVVTYPTGTTNEDTYQYNAADQRTETKMVKGAETLASLKYSRDQNGGVMNTKVTGLPGEAELKDTNDKAGRLTQSGASFYEYDSANNATLIPGSANAYDAGSQLEKGTGVAYSYDELGERTKRTPTTGPVTAYGYDQAGNLASVTRPKEGETPSIEDAYGYNGDGLRMSETIGATTAYLAWETDRGLPLILSDGTNSYIYGPDAVPVEQISSGGTVTYLHHDQQGSTRLLTASTGTVTGSTTFDAYGNKTGSTGTSTTPLGYDAQYTSSDTGLIYMRARVYEPATAQFLTVDPLLEGTKTLAHPDVGQYVVAAMRSASGSGPYVYANDNPLNNADPTGLLTVGICVHGEVNFIIHIGASGCGQVSTGGEVGGTVVGSAGIAQGAGVGVTVGPQVANAAHIPELSGRFYNAGGQLGLGPDVTLEAFGAPGDCGPIVGGGVSAGAGLGVSRWTGVSYTGAWGLHF